jgi:hypothetical protein
MPSGLWSNGRARLGGPEIAGKAEFLRLLGRGVGYPRIAVSTQISARETVLKLLHWQNPSLVQRELELSNLPVRCKLAKQARGPGRKPRRDSH